MGSQWTIIEHNVTTSRDGVLNQNKNSRVNWYAAGQTETAMRRMYLFTHFRMFVIEQITELW